MGDLMLELLNKEIPFVFDGTDININELNISYDKYFKLYNVSYGGIGCPYLKIFKDAGEVVDFIKNIKNLLFKKTRS
ncbi:hypothetical protein [Clostridium disporicum]|uniref:hypothetical protein n=1 Tax=Clostridium disporicum TaxID=84024 RepID=UPI0034A2CF01